MTRHHVEPNLSRRRSTCPGSPRTSSSGRSRSRRSSSSWTRGTPPRSSPATARSGPAGWTRTGSASSATGSADLRQLTERKQTILKTIEAQGKLTDELRKAILTAETPKRVEDLYLPFKPKKRTPAADAREKGLGELAQAIWNRDPAVANLPEVLAGMVNPEKGLNSAEEVLAGAKLILTEMIAEIGRRPGPGPVRPVGDRAGSSSRKAEPSRRSRRSRRNRPARRRNARRHPPPAEQRRRRTR